MKDTSVLGHPSLVPRSGGCPCPAAQLCRAGGQQATLASASGQGRECGSRGSAWLCPGVHPACTPAAPAQNPNRAPTSPPIPGEDRIVSGSELGCHTAGDDEHNQGLNCRDQGRKNRTQPNPVRSTPLPQEPPPQRGLQAPWRRVLHCKAACLAEHHGPCTAQLPTHLSSSSVMVPRGSASTLFPQNLSFG